MKTGDLFIKLCLTKRVLCI